MKATGRGKAHGKVIVMGEHAAVAGEPAVVTALSLQLHATVGEVAEKTRENPLLTKVRSVFFAHTGKSVDDLPIEISSELPVGSGLGSSAAVASALLQALADFHGLYFSKEELLKLVFECEMFAHGKASGIDPVAVVHRGLLRFQRQAGELTFEHIKTEILTGKKFFLHNSGKPVEAGKELIVAVQDRAEADPEFRAYLSEIGRLSSQFVANLRANIFSPELFTENERLLEKLDVVSPYAQKIIRYIEEVGGYAKMTGAGGRKHGAGMLLIYHPDEEKVQYEMSKKKYPLIPFHFDV